MRCQIEKVITLADYRVDGYGRPTCSPPSLSAMIRGHCVRTQVAALEGDRIRIDHSFRSFPKSSVLLANPYYL